MTDEPHYVCVDAPRGFSPKAVREALDAEIQAVLDSGASLSEIWVVDPPKKWKIVDGPRSGE